MNFQQLYFLTEAKEKVKPNDKDAAALITPEWLKKRKLEISKLQEPWESSVEEVAPGIMGAMLGKINGHKVFAVDATKVQLKYDMDFVVAGNHEKWPWIPAGQFWVDKSYRMMDAAHDLLHESTEQHIMKKLHWEYDDAHIYANKIEKQYTKDLLKNRGMIRKMSIGID